MAKVKDAGVYKMENGLWAYRFAIMVDGKQVARRKSTDANGNKLRTKKDAIKARETAIEQAHLERARKKEVQRRTVKEVYSEYCKNGRVGICLLIILNTHFQSVFSGFLPDPVSYYNKEYMTHGVR